LKDDALHALHALDWRVSLISTAAEDVALVGSLIAIVLAGWIRGVAGRLAHRVSSRLANPRYLSAQHMSSKRGEQKNTLKPEDPGEATKPHL
jgi:hypothetical protein